MIEIEGTFTIPERKQEAAAEAVRMMDPSKLVGRTTFAWVDPDALDEVTTIEEALLTFGMQVTQRGDAFTINYSGKYGDEEVLFRTLAKFVEPGGSIYVDGEEAEHWRYVFSDPGAGEGSDLVKESGRIVYGPGNE